MLCKTESVMTNKVVPGYITFPEYVLLLSFEKHSIRVWRGPYSVVAVAQDRQRNNAAAERVAALFCPRSFVALTLLLATLVASTALLAVHAALTTPLWLSAAACTLNFPNVKGSNKEISHNTLRPASCCFCVSTSRRRFDLSKRRCHPANKSTPLHFQRAMALCRGNVLHRSLQCVGFMPLRFAHSGYRAADGGASASGDVHALAAQTMLLHSTAAPTAVVAAACWQYNCGRSTVGQSTMRSFLLARKSREAGRCHHNRPSSSNCSTLPRAVVCSRQHISSDKVSNALYRADNVSTSRSFNSCSRLGCKTRGSSTRFLSSFLEQRSSRQKDELRGAPYVNIEGRPDGPLALLLLHALRLNGRKPSDALALMRARCLSNRGRSDAAEPPSIITHAQNVVYGGQSVPSAFSSPTAGAGVSSYHLQHRGTAAWLCAHNRRRCSSSSITVRPSSSNSSSNPRVACNALNAATSFTTGSNGSSALSGSIGSSVLIDSLRSSPVLLSDGLNSSSSLGGLRNSKSNRGSKIVFAWRDTKRGFTSSSSSSSSSPSQSDSAEPAEDLLLWKKSNNRREDGKNTPVVFCGEISQQAELKQQQQIDWLEHQQHAADDDIAKTAATIGARSLNIVENPANTQALLRPMLTDVSQGPQKEHPTTLDTSPSLLILPSTGAGAGGATPTTTTPAASSPPHSVSRVVEDHNRTKVRSPFYAKEEEEDVGGRGGGGGGGVYMPNGAAAAAEGYYYGNLAAAEPPNNTGETTPPSHLMLQQQQQQTHHPHQQFYQAAVEHDTPVSMQRLFNSVVKVYSDYTDPNYSLPWQMHRQGTSTGSGFVLRDRLIMTNAHCVSWNNRLQVRKHGSPNKYVARILAVGHECDLALITVDDEDFWKGDVAELEFGEVPSLQDAVVVLGYPRGGDNLCITSGVVSRVDVNPYAHSNTCLLCVQIDAAINPGNSGGPALKEGRVVGVAFQGFDNAQNIGYIVPTSVIQHFLEDVRRHRCYTGFPSAGILFQHLENKSMQAFLGMDCLTRTDLPAGVEASGILVTMADELRPKQYLRLLEQRRKKMLMKKEENEQGETVQLHEGVNGNEKQTRGDSMSSSGSKSSKSNSSSSSNSGSSNSNSSSTGSSSSSVRNTAAGSNKRSTREKGNNNISSSSSKISDVAVGEAHATRGEAPTGMSEKNMNEDEPQKRKKKSVLLEKKGEAQQQQHGKSLGSKEEKNQEEDLRTPEGVHVGLKKNDVILAIDGVDVANDGTVFFRDMERVNVSHTISSKFVGDTITATVLRKKKVLNVLVPLIHENALVPKHQWDMKARYLIYGGLVFCPLTLEYLKDEFGVKFNERAPSSLLQPLADIFAKEEGEEPIVLSHILASDLTSGYMFRNCLLTHVNGMKVLNMRHLAMLLGLKVPPPILLDSTLPALHAGETMLQRKSNGASPLSGADAPLKNAPGALEVAVADAPLKNAAGTLEVTDPATSSLIDSAAPVTDAAAAALLRAAAADAAIAAHCARLQERKTTQQTTDQLEDKQHSEKKENDFVIFLLEEKVQLVLERAKAESMQPHILKQHAIYSPTSDVL